MINCLDQLHEDRSGFLAISHLLGKIETGRSGTEAIRSLITSYAAQLTTVITNLSAGATTPATAPRRRGRPKTTAAKKTSAVGKVTTRKAAKEKAMPAGA